MKQYNLHNGNLSARISSLGGELLSLTHRDTELIWPGDPAYWEGSAPFLFPFCGRVKDGVYRWSGKEYAMPIHGFLPSAQLTVEDHTADSLTLILSDSEDLRKIYPFSFKLTLRYQLSPTELTVTATIAAGDTGLPFSFGAHPGFNLPCTAEGFADAQLRFDSTAPLTRIEITESGLLGDGRTDYPLSDKVLSLAPDPAVGCGIFFEIAEQQRAVTLSAPALPCDIRIEFADFPVLGLWHAPGAPFLCIEPWQGLPAPDGAPTALAEKPAAIILAPGERKTFALRIILQQKGICHV